MRFTLDPQLLGLIIFFLLLNLAAFMVMLSDKIRAGKEGAERVSEGLMFFMAAFFGSLGVYAGMFAFRHKTRKWYFLIGIPLLLIENCATLYVFYRYFNP